MKRSVYNVILLLLCLCTLCACAKDYDNGAVRLHVIANSDSDEDQSVKLAVRDRILETYADRLSALQSDTKVWQELESMSGGLESCAQKVLEEKGFDYDAVVKLGIFDFPKRDYMGLVYPAGRYRGVRIVLGRGAGRNWWCVMYPPLCLLKEDTDDDWGAYFARLEQYDAQKGVPEKEKVTSAPKTTQAPKSPVRSYFADRLGLSKKFDELIARHFTALREAHGHE